MSGARAILTDAPFSPHKARLVADMVRGRSVQAAWDTLHFNTKRPARAIEKLLRSAMANARELAQNEKWHDGEELNEDDLVVRRITVDDGARLKRIQPRARGMAYGIVRRRCTITLEIDDRKQP